MSAKLITSVLYFVGLCLFALGIDVSFGDGPGLQVLGVGVVSYAFLYGMFAYLNPQRHTTSRPHYR